MLFLKACSNLRLGRRVTSGAEEWKGGGGRSVRDRGAPRMAPRPGPRGPVLRSPFRHHSCERARLWSLAVSPETSGSFFARDHRLSWRFSAAGIRERGEKLDPQKGNRRVQCRGATGLPGGMVCETLPKVGGAADVDDARSESEEVDDRSAPRPIRRHSQGFGDQRVHWIRLGRSEEEGKPFGAFHLLRAIRRADVPASMSVWFVTTRAFGHEQAKRVEWLPGLDSNQD